MIATVLTALDAALGDFDQRSVFRYLRSALSGVDYDTCDRLENYAFLWDIRGNRWLSDWKNHPDGLGNDWTEEAKSRLELLNRERRRLMEPLEQLRQGFRNASSLNSQVEALYQFLERVGMEQRLEAMAQELDETGSNRESQILNQLWEILMSALEQMYDVLGQTHWEPEHFVRLLRLLLSQYDVGTIPPVLDVVQLGPVTSMRCHSQKHLILLGAQEGSLPAYSGSAGVLTDQERVTLRALGVPLTGGAMEGVQAEFAEIYGVFCGALESVYVLSSGKQTSFIYRRLASLSGCDGLYKDALGFADADGQEAGAFLARWKQRSIAEALGVDQAYEVTRTQADFSLGTVSPEHIRKLYGSSLMLSASQVDKQAECRLSYFLNYGLRAKERKTAAVDPAEFGSYVHDVLEHTAAAVRDQGGFPAMSLEKTLEIAHGFSERYALSHFNQIESQRMEYLFRRNLRELDMVVEELWRELCQSGFQPEGFEVGFGTGEEGALPAIPIPNGKINALLRGYVDRVDVWKSPGSEYYRVVDYKTGKKDFDYCDVFNGVGLQMLLYLFALKKSGNSLLDEHSIPAGVQYFPARVRYISTDGVPEPEQIEKERQKDWRRQGLLLNDRAVLDAMEPGEEKKRLPVKEKKGELTGYLADRQQMQLLERYILRVLGGLVEDIASGNVQPNPYTRGSSHNACRFCPYGQVCHSDSVEGRRNYKAMTAEQFWEQVEREMTKMAEKLTPAQSMAVHNRGGKLLVSAAAGSGKTKVLVDRLMDYLQNPQNPAHLDEFLIITYTKAAAMELRGKIAAGLNRCIAQNPENKHLQRQMQRLFLTQISTVHGFCSTILREYAYRVDLPPDFRVAEEAECADLREAVLKDLMERAYENGCEGNHFREFVDSQGVGRDDRAIPDIILKVYSAARCHQDPQKWLDDCLDNVKLDGVTDAADTIWGKSLMDSLFDWLDVQIGVQRELLRRLERDEGVEKPIANIGALVQQLEYLRDSKTWDDVYTRKNIDFGKLTFSGKNTTRCWPSRLRPSEMPARQSWKAEPGALLMIPAR